MAELPTKTAPDDEAELYAQQEAAHAELQRVNRELSGAAQLQAHDTWVKEYAHLFFWCCGSPVFGGADSESYYEQNKWTRGLEPGRTAVLHGI